jgi:hypothetical protein
VVSPSPSACWWMPPVVVVENVETQLSAARRGSPPAPAPPDPPSHPRSGRTRGLGHPHHRHRVPAAADPRRAGGQDFSSPVALTIVFALSASLILSLTVVPVLASFLLKRGEAHEIPGWCARLQAGYMPLLGMALARGRLVGRGRLRLAGRRRRRVPGHSARPSCPPWTKATSSCSSKSCPRSAWPQSID